MFMVHEKCIARAQIPATHVAAPLANVIPGKLFTSRVNDRYRATVALIYGSAMIAAAASPACCVLGVNSLLHFPRWRLSRRQRRIHISSPVLTRLAMAHVADVGSVEPSRAKIRRGLVRHRRIGRSLSLCKWLFAIARSPTARNHAVYQRKLLAFAACRAGGVAGVAHTSARVFIYVSQRFRARSVLKLSWISGMRGSREGFIAAFRRARRRDA